jgi:hypothetical protein
METVSLSAVASTSPGLDFTQSIRDLPRQLANFITEQNRPNSNERQFNFRDRRSRSSSRRSNSNSRSSSTRRSPFRRESTNTLYWYHRRYGDRALHLQLAGKLELQTSAAANVCNRDIGRLFISDKISKRRFIINTVSDLCVFPRKLIPQPRYVLTKTSARLTALPSPHTDGCLSVNLGLRRELSWRFVMANVTQPLIGAEFLSHFGLSVDCRNNRMLEDVTSLSTPAQSANPRIRSIKISVAVHRSTFSSPSFQTSLAPVEFSETFATTRPTTSGLHRAHLPTTSPRP